MLPATLKPTEKRALDLAFRLALDHLRPPGRAVGGAAF